MLPRSIVLVFALAPLLAAMPAVAQGHDPATAEALFAQGREAMKQGDFETARAKLLESQALDPAPGTVLNLAECEEKVGKLAQAWQHWRQTLELLPPGDSRTEYVRGRLKAIEPTVPQLVLRLPPHPPAGIRVRRGDVEVGEASLGSPLPVDPGPTEVVVTAPGFEPGRYHLELHERELRELSVNVGPTVPLPPAAEANPWRTTGWVAGGVGLAGLGLGAVTGGLAIDRNNALNDLCTPGPGRVCHGDWSSVANAGRTYATISTASFIAGAVLLGAGASLALTHPKRALLLRQAALAATSGLVVSW